jgi:hypothetical protein
VDDAEAQFQETKTLRDFGSKIFLGHLIIMNGWGAWPAYPPVQRGGWGAEASQTDRRGAIPSNKLAPTKCDERNGNGCDAATDLSGDACLERAWAADPLHRAGCDPKLLGNLTHPRSAGSRQCLLDTRLDVGV